MPTLWLHPTPTVKRVVPPGSTAPGDASHGRLALALGVVAMVALIGLGIWALAVRDTGNENEAVPAVPAVPSAPSAATRALWGTT